MNSPVPALVFGALLILMGTAMLYSLRHPRSQEPRSNHEELYLRKRRRRRTQVAGMILLVGFMIPIGDSLISWKNAPGTFAVYWIIVITLALWIGLLAIGDMAATRAYLANELNQLHRRHLELHRVAQRARDMRSDEQRNR